MTAALVALAACREEPARNDTDVDIAKAANAARASMEAYRTNARQPVEKRPTVTSVATSVAANDVTAIVRRYQALVAAAHDGQARLLWRNPDSAVPPPSLAASRRYRAELGTPRLDGRDHAVVPVVIAGEDDAGTPFRLAGDMTLHRMTQGWRVVASTVRPRRAAGEPIPANMPAVATARYTCRDGSTWHARFDNRAETVVLTGSLGAATLEGQRPASGIWYAAKDWELRGKGATATLARPGAPPVDCTAR